jgi:hypothetical protein
MSTPNNGLPGYIEALAKLKLTSTQFRILNLISVKTTQIIDGEWVSKPSPISGSDIAKATGLHPSLIRKDLLELVKLNIVRREFVDTTAHHFGSAVSKPPTSINMVINDWKIQPTCSPDALGQDKNLARSSASSQTTERSPALGQPPTCSPDALGQLDNNTSQPNNSASLDNKYGFDAFYPSSDIDDVLLTKKQYEKLIVKFGEQGTAERVEELSLYMARKGVTYNDHYAQILTYERYKNQHLDQGQPPVKHDSRRENTDPDKYIKGKYGHIVQR